jgi:hypothetical protein
LATVPVEVERRADELVTVLFGPEMATIALGVLGGIGVMLSICGIFGMAAHSVSRRLKELGIRMALGAECSFEGNPVSRRFFVTNHETAKKLTDILTSHQGENVLAIGAVDIPRT